MLRYIQHTAVQPQSSTKRSTETCLGEPGVLLFLHIGTVVIKLQAQSFLFPPYAQALHTRAGVLMEEIASAELLQTHAFVHTNIVTEQVLCADD